MIEKFTPEELSVIRAELKQLPRNHLKKYFLQPVEIFLDKLFNWKMYSDRFIFPTNDILKAMTCITDHTFGCYEQKPYKKRICWYRNPCVKDEFKDEYLEMCKEIAAIVAKHKKEPDFSNELPRDYLKKGGKL